MSSSIQLTMAKSQRKRKMKDLFLVTSCQELCKGKCIPESIVWLPYRASAIFFVKVKVGGAFTVDDTEITKTRGDACAARAEDHRTVSGWCVARLIPTAFNDQETRFVISVKNELDSCCKITFKNCSYLGLKGGIICSSLMRGFEGRQCITAQHNAGSGVLYILSYWAPSAVETWEPREKSQLFLVYNFSLRSKCQ